MGAPPRSNEDEIRHVAGVGTDLVVEAGAADDVFRLWRENENFPRIVLDVQHGTILTGNGSVAPTSIVTASPAFFGNPGPTQFVNFANGNDANNGFSWATAKLTMQSAATYLTTSGDGLIEGDIYIANNTPHILTDQLNIAQGISIHGVTHSNIFGNGATGFNGGTQIVWNGPNTVGKAVISTQYPSIPEGGYAAGSVMENFSIYIPTTTIGGAATTNITGMDCRNWQNHSVLRDVAIVGGAGRGFYFSVNGATSPAGFISLERCWVYGGGTRPFTVDAGLEQIEFRHCGVDDPNNRALAWLTISISTGDVRGLTVALYSCKDESTAGDYPFVEVQAGVSADCSVALYSCFEQSAFAGTKTTPVVSYLATPSQPDDGIAGVPVAIYSHSSQSRQFRIKAPNATPPLNVPTETAPGGGSRDRFTWDRGDRGAYSILSTSTAGTLKRRVTVVDATGGAKSMPLPTAIGIPGTAFTLKKSDASANAVTMTTTGGQTIDGAATKVLATQNAVATVVSDGTNWMIV